MQNKTYYGAKIHRLRCPRLNDLRRDKGKGRGEMVKKTDTKQAEAGVANRGQFKPGHSGNPKGRPRTIEDKELKELDKIENQVKAIDGQKDGRYGPEPAKVFRLIGFGEIAVARIVKRLAEKSKSDVVKIRACELAAKILRMIREDSRQHEGVTVIIEAFKGSAQQINVTPPRQGPPQEQPAYNHPQPLKAGMPVHIIK